MDPLTPQIWYTYRTEMLLNLISRSVRCKDSIWGLVKGKFCRIHISIAWCLASFDPSARGFLQETRRLPYFIHLHGTCSTVSCLELTPADCGTFAWCLCRRRSETVTTVSIWCEPSWDRFRDWGKLLLHISLVWRSFTDLSEWIRSANSRWLSQSLATFGKRCIRQAWRKSYSLFIITHYLDWLYHHQSVLDASITEKWWSGA